MSKNESKLEDKSLSVKAISNKILFSIHSFVYLAVNLLLILIWALTVGISPVKYFWPMFAEFGWGFAVGLHMLLYLMYNDKLACLSKFREKSASGILFFSSFMVLWHDSYFLDDH